MDKKPGIHNNLFKTYEALGLPLDDVDPDAGFTIHNIRAHHPDLPFTSTSYRPEYFSFLFVKNGRGRYTIDDLTFETEPGTIYFTNPGHVKSFHWREMEEVYLITFSEAYLKEHVQSDVFREFPFLLAEIVRPRVLPPVVFRVFEELYRQIDREYHSDSPYRHKIIAALFVVLLLKIKENFFQDYNPLHEGTRGSQIVKTFKKNLERHNRDLITGKTEKPYRVQDYASLQNLHPSYLNNVIKTKTGKPISTWITEKTMAEAKSLLQNSTLSIKEIAYSLGFSESTHFSNYFKKNAGQSPADYRRHL